MPNASPSADGQDRLPSWVPKEASTYLQHTEAGRPIRALARDAGVHASTVLRQVRALEARREDVLVDKALDRLGRRLAARRASEGGEDSLLSREELHEEARRVLRRLCEPGTVLAVAAEMDKAVVVRETENGETVRRAVVERGVAEAMALNGWIACERPARISRYRITGAGRTMLNRLLAEAENRAVGFAEAQAGFSGPAGTTSGSRDNRRRGQPLDTPLALLARRRDSSGKKFLSEDLVHAGERLREDYETARFGARRAETWDQFLSRAEAQAPRGEEHRASRAARARVVGALRDLGPGLGDVVLGCCCHLEGLESAERRLGWSARSGKVVLRIALQRLKRYYDALGEEGALMG